MSQDDFDNPIDIQNIEAGEAMQDFKDHNKQVTNRKLIYLK